ncbi:hypothetical protein ACWEOE_25705 [Amycolatopsis sp. NPDC004368]
MTAARGPGVRGVEIPAFPEPHRVQWQLAEVARAEWLDHALSCEPADRPAAEAAISALYALEGSSSPQFVWVDSPGAAAQLVPPNRGLTYGAVPQLENRMAGSVSTSDTDPSGS